MKGSHYRKCWI